MECGYVALHLGLIEVKALEVGEAVECGYVALYLRLGEAEALEVGEALERGYVTRHFGFLQSKYFESNYFAQIGEVSICLFQAKHLYCAARTFHSRPFTWVSFSFEPKAFQLSCHLLFIGALGCFWNGLSPTNV